MSFFATCAGLQIVAGELLIPLVGAWTADLHLASSQQLSGSVQVQIGNLTLQGFVFRSEVYGGQTRARLVAGAGGWRTAVKPQGYGSSSGVMLSTIMKDVASACGETVNVPNDTSVGNAFARVAFDDSLASDVLWQMVSLGFAPAWYIDPTGTTQIAAWPTAAVATAFTVTDQRTDKGLVVVATEDYASWMPGCTFTNPLTQGTLTSAGIHYVWDNDGKFRFEVLTAGAGASDRFLGPISEMVTKEIQPMRFFGRYAYTISNPTAKAIDGTPKNSKLGLPTLQNVTLTSDSVSTYTPPNGGDAHIMFVDGDPTQPVCVWTAQTPTMAQILGGNNPVARLGDQVQIFFPPEVPFTSTSPPATGTFSIPNPLTGVITQGSSEVTTA